MLQSKGPRAHRVDVVGLVISVAAIAMLVAAAITSWLLQS
ncbi:MAG: hypothetical protein QOJ11_347 [Frankiales bacterium]|jgi:hypothetical protein|nr:hypothetical protein [Frankiales bacterium]